MANVNIDWDTVDWENAFDTAEEIAISSLGKRLDANRLMKLDYKKSYKEFVKIVQKAGAPRDFINGPDFDALFSGFVIFQFGEDAQDVEDEGETLFFAMNDGTVIVVDVDSGHFEQSFDEF